MKSWQMQVRQIQEKDWEACWKVQHESHSSEKRFSADTWLFICKNLTDSFVVVDENDIVIAYWIGSICVNDFHLVDDLDDELSCLAIDVCTHFTYQNQGIMDLIMPIVTQYHARIHAYTHKDNLAANGIMTKWGFKKGPYIEENEHYYWSYERDNT